MAVEIKPGDRVRIRLSNGYTDTGTIVRCYKNGGEEADWIRHIYLFQDCRRITYSQANARISAIAFSFES